MKRDVPEVWFQPLDGPWQPVVDQPGAGVKVENLRYTFEDDGGPAEAFFDLTSDSAQLVGQFKLEPPVAIKVGGAWVWRGRSVRTPGHHGDTAKTTVECQGIREHTKDFPTDRAYVIADLTRFQNARSAGSNLSNFTTAPDVTTDTGGVTLSMPAGYAPGTGAGVGVTLDMGPNNTAARVVLGWASSNNLATLSANIRVSSSPDIMAGGTDTSFTMASGTSGTTAYSPTAGRYVHIFLYPNAAVGALAADVWLKLTSIVIATSTAYESGGASVLKFSDIAKSQLSLVCPQISTDQSLIQSTSFSIPEFDPRGRLTAYENMKAGNSYHGWQLLYTGDPTPKAVLRPVPTVPKYVIGIDDVWEFDTPTTNDTTQVFTDVFVNYQTGDGKPAEQWVVSGSNPTFLPQSELSSSNPSFDVDTSGWTLMSGSGASLTRDTVKFASTPASLHIAWGAPSAVYRHTFTGTAKAGRTYRIQFALACTPGNTGIRVGGNGTLDNVTYSANFSSTTAAAFTTVYVDWTPMVDTAGFYLEAFNSISTTDLWIDSIQIYRAASTLLDRRGSRRATTIRPKSKQNATSATKLGQLFLDTHQFAPLGGSGKLSQPYIREAGTDAHIQIERVAAGDVVRFEHLRDPNTQALGRTAVVKRAEIDVTAGTLAFVLDNNVNEIEVMDARMAVMLGRRGL